MAFWFSLVLLVLPLDTGNDADMPSVGAIQAFMAAREAVGDVTGICERKPDVCETGKSALHVIGVRAREGARMAADMLEDETDKSAAIEQPDMASKTGGIPTPQPAPARQ